MATEYFIRRKCLLKNSRNTFLKMNGLKLKDILGCQFQMDEVVDLRKLHIKLKVLYMLIGMKNRKKHDKIEK